MLKCMSVAVWFTDVLPDLTYTWINFIQSSNGRILSIAFHLLYLNNLILIVSTLLIGWKIDVNSVTRTFLWGHAHLLPELLWATNQYGGYRQRCICENKINIYTITKNFWISSVIYHSCVFRTTSSTTRWLNISKLYAYANKQLRAKSRFELESPIYNKWALFFELPGFFFICICILLLHFFFQQKLLSSTDCTGPVLGFNKISFSCKSLKFSYPPCSDP